MYPMILAGNAVIVAGIGVLTMIHVEIEGIQLNVLMKPVDENQETQKVFEMKVSKCELISEVPPPERMESRFGSLLRMNLGEYEFKSIQNSILLHPLNSIDFRIHQHASAFIMEFIPKLKDFTAIRILSILESMHFYIRIPRFTTTIFPNSPETSSALNLSAGPLSFDMKFGLSEKLIHHQHGMFEKSSSFIFVRKLPIPAYCLSTVRLDSLQLALYDQNTPDCVILAAGCDTIWLRTSYAVESDAFCVMKCRFLNLYVSDDGGRVDEDVIKRVCDGLWMNKLRVGGGRGGDGDPIADGGALGELLKIEPGVCMKWESISVQIAMDTLGKQSIQVATTSLIVAIHAIKTAALITSIHARMKRLRPAPNSNAMPDAAPTQDVKTHHNGATKKQAKAEGLLEYVNLELVLNVEKSCVLFYSSECAGDAGTLGLCLHLGSTRESRLNVIGSERNVHGCFALNDTRTVHIMEDTSPENNVRIDGLRLDFNVRTKSNRVSAFRPRLTWTPDFQGGLLALKPLASPLVSSISRMKSSELSSSTKVNEKCIDSDDRSVMNATKDALQVPVTWPKTSVEERKYIKVPAIVGELEVFVQYLKIEFLFPEGISGGAIFGQVGPFFIKDDMYPGKDLIYVVNQTPLAYAKDFKYRNPIPEYVGAVLFVQFELFHTRLLLPVKYSYGNQWASFMMRMKVYMQELKQKKILSTGLRKPKVFPQLLIKSYDAIAFIEDSELDAFLTTRLPLFEDSARQRDERLASFNQRLSTLNPQILEHHGDKLLRLMLEQESAIVIHRVNEFRKNYPRFYIADCFKLLSAPPLAQLLIEDGDYRLFRDEAMIQNPVEYNVKKYVEMDVDKSHVEMTRKPESFYERGFRKMEFELKNVALKLRDYEDTVIQIGSWKCTGEIGMVITQSNPPYCVEFEFPMGVRSIGKIRRGLDPVRLFWDNDVTLENVNIQWNHSMMPAFIDFTRQFPRFGPDAKDPSPRQPWFDVIRLLMHGRIDTKIVNLNAKIDAQPSPYSKMTRWMNLSLPNAQLSLSKLTTTLCPIQMTLENLSLSPRTFRPAPSPQSHVQIAKLHVKFYPTYTVSDPKRLSWNHYIAPFVDHSKPLSNSFQMFRVGKGQVPMNLYEDWRKVRLPWTYKVDRNTHDSYKEFRSQSIAMEIDIKIQFTRESKRSVLTSDGLSTILRFTRMISSGNPTFAAPPRVIDPLKPIAKETLGSLLRKMSIRVSVRDIDLELWNNLEPGHAIAVKLDAVSFTMQKARSHEKDSVEMLLTKREAWLSKLLVDIVIPKMDVGSRKSTPDRGFLMSARRIALQTAATNAALNSSSTLRSGATFSGRNAGTSPFHAFSAGDDYQRGKRLDDDKFRDSIVVEGLRLFWTPDRRDASFDWPTVFAERSLMLKTPRQKKNAAKPSAKDKATGTQDVIATPVKANDEGETSISVGPKSAATLQTLARELEGASGVGLETHAVNAHEESAAASARKASAAAETAEQEWRARQKTVVSRDPVASVFVRDVQVLFQSAEMKSVVVLAADEMIVTIVRKTLTEDGDSWTETEIKLSLEQAEIYAVTRYLELFTYGETWVPRRVDTASIMALSPKHLRRFEKVTERAFYLDMLYAAAAPVETSSASVARPAKLLINLPELPISSTSVQFRAVMDVVTQIMMRRSRFNLQVQEELLHFSYSLTLAGVRSASKTELIQYVDQVRDIVMLFDYAVDTGDYEVVEHFLSTNSGANEDDSRMRLDGRTSKRTLIHDEMERNQRRNEEVYALRRSYVAKLRALLTYLKKEHRGTASASSSSAPNASNDTRESSVSELYPSMYLSYSFDSFRWALKHAGGDQDAQPFLELKLSELVCRHVFYVGRVSNQEFTFGDIEIVNLESETYVLRTDFAIANVQEQSNIKASDGSAVAFRWYATQSERVGGIAVFDNLIVHVLPLTASLTNRTVRSMKLFLFTNEEDPDRTRDESEDEDENLEGILDQTHEEHDDGASESAEHDVTEFMKRLNEAAEEDNKRYDDEDVRADDEVRVSKSEERKLKKQEKKKKKKSEKENARVKRDPSRAVTSQVAAKGAIIQGYIAKARSHSLETMKNRADESIFFRYIYIGKVQLTLSLRREESRGSGYLEVKDLVLSAPSTMYNSCLWSWRELFKHVMRDVVKTTALTGVRNLAKQKLLGVTTAGNRLKTRARLLLDKDFGGDEEEDVEKRQNATEATEEQPNLKSIGSSNVNLNKKMSSVGGFERTNALRMNVDRDATSPLGTENNDPRVQQQVNAERHRAVLDLLYGTHFEDSSHPAQSGRTN